MTIILGIFCILMLLLFLGIPIAFAIGLASLASVFMFGIDIKLTLIPGQMFSGLDSFALMAVPFFVMAGEVMNKAGITYKIIDLCDSIVGHLKGGLTYVNILAAMIMAGISGSGTADAAALGTTLIPNMEEKGYPLEFAVALTAAANTVGPIIPPSTLFILYGYYTSTSISALFLGGILPGVIIGLSMMVLSYFICKAKGYRQENNKFNLKRLLKAVEVGGVACLIPVFIVVSITTGFCTATEAGVLIVAVSFALGYIYKSIRTWKEVYEVLHRSLINTAVIFAMLATSGIFANILARARFQQIVILAVGGLINSSTLLMFAIVIFVLILGMFVDVAPMVIMFSAAFCGVAVKAGMDPVAFGVTFVIACMLGSITPPVGCLLFITTQIAKISMTRVIKPIFPYIVLYFGIVILLVLFPKITTLIPSLL
jgi:tripartite ATP-independent transporter DctM subunit